MAKSRPTLNLVSKTAASSSTAQSSSASNGPGIPKAPCQQGLNLKACAGKPSVESYSMCGETCSRRLKSKWRSVEFSCLAIRCKDERKRGETCCHRDKPEHGLSSKCGETCGWRFRCRQRWFSVAKQFPKINWLRPTSWESLFGFTTETWS